VLGQEKRGNGPVSQALLRATACAAWAVLGLALTSCATQEPAVWSGPALPGVSGALPETLPDGVDRRVVNGIAWVSSDSAGDSSWLRHRIDVLEAVDLRPCLEGEGVSADLLVTAADSRERSSARTISPQFPDVLRVESQGLWPARVTDPETRWSPIERGAVAQCRQRNRSRPSARAREADDTLRRAFEDLVAGRPDPVLAKANAGFAVCMGARGYPRVALGDPRSFLAWASRNRADDDPAGKRVGADYVVCGTPVWRSMERARAAVRLAFIDARASDLRLLSSLVQDA
jgi:hypothetical protein